MNEMIEFLEVRMVTPVRFHVSFWVSDSKLFCNYSLETLILVGFPSFSGALFFGLVFFYFFSMKLVSIIYIYKYECII